MNEDTKKYGDVSQFVLNILLIAGSLSAVFYISGLINYISYYSFFEIKPYFLDFQYYDYLLQGIILHLLLIVVLFPYLFNWYVTLVKLNSIKDDILVFNEKNPIKSKKTSYPIEKVKKELIKQVDELKNSLTRTSMPIRLFVTVVVAILAAVFLKNMRIVFSLASLSIGYLQVFIYEWLANRTAMSRNPFMHASMWFPMIFVGMTIFFVPMVTGYLEAVVNMKEDGFDKYEVIMSNANKLENAKLLYFGKDQYFFLNGKRLLIIPKQEIVSLNKY